MTTLVILGILGVVLVAALALWIWGERGRLVLPSTRVSREGRLLN